LLRLSSLAIQGLNAVGANLLPFTVNFFGLQINFNPSFDLNVGMASKSAFFRTLAAQIANVAHMFDCLVKRILI